MARQRTLTPQELSAQIKLDAYALGFDLVGISPVLRPPRQESFAEWLHQGFAGEMGYLPRSQPLRDDPQTLAPWSRSIISVALNYHTPFACDREYGDNEPRGWISRYAWGDDYHDVLKEKLRSLLAQLESHCQQPVQGRAFVDSAPVMERAFAGVAGVGWIGKNTQLISPKKGSWLFLGELFVDLALAYDRPIRQRCGQCDLCLKACPTQAFVGPYVLDARRCISYLTIELKGFIPRPLRPLIGKQIFGCDICQDVCPYNVKAGVTAESAFYPRDGLHAPALIPLLALSESEFRSKFKGSPVLRAKRRGFLRNVAVALGNSRAREAVPALGLALNDAEAMIRGHAAWALGEIGGNGAAECLRARLLIESDSQVVDEIEVALAAIGR